MANKKLSLNINPVVFLLTNLFSCGKNSIYKGKDIAFRLIQSAIHKHSLEAMFKLTRYLSADRILDKLHTVSMDKTKDLIKKGTKHLKLPGKVRLAIDFTDKIYYGDKNHPEVMGSKGGKYVRRYIQVSTVKPALFLNALPVNQLTNDKGFLLIQLLDAFYRQFRKTKLELLLLDRGFFTKKVVRLLIENKIPFIMPAIKDKAIQKLVEAYDKGDLDSKIKYKFGGVTINLLFLKADDEILVYATNTRKDVMTSYMDYRKRWQIETNFREQNNLTFRTTSTDFDIRYLAFALAGLLFNAWQLARSMLPYALESYLFKQYLVEEILSTWQKIAGKEVVKTIDYFLVA
jgi:hypothetical protein